MQISGGSHMSREKRSRAACILLFTRSNQASGKMLNISVILKHLKIRSFLRVQVHLRLLVHTLITCSCFCEQNRNCPKRPMAPVLLPLHLLSVVVILPSLVGISFIDLASNLLIHVCICSSPKSFPLNLPHKKCCIHLKD